MSEKSPMPDREQAMHFASELDNLVDRFRAEYDIPLMIVIGVLTTKSHLLIEEGVRGRIMSEESSTHNGGEDQDRQRIVDAVEHAANQISEHVDSVQIIVTYHEGDNKVTAAYECGVGNFYARVQSCREFVLRQDEFVKAHAWKQQNGSDPEMGED